MLVAVVASLGALILHGCGDKPPSPPPAPAPFPPSPPPTPSPPLTVSVKFYSSEGKAVLDDSVSLRMVNGPHEWGRAPDFSPAWVPSLQTWMWLSGYDPTKIYDDFWVKIQVLRDDSVGGESVQSCHGCSSLAIDLLEPNTVWTTSDTPLVDFDLLPRISVRKFDTHFNQTGHDDYILDGRSNPSSIIMRSKGDVYFSDRRREAGLYKLKWGSEEDEIPKDAIADNTKLGADFVLAFNSDESKLYVADTYSNRVDVFAVDPDGFLTHADSPKTKNMNVKGIQVDALDNIWVAGREGIHVWSRDFGSLIAEIFFDGGATGLAFGGAEDGKDLMITSRWSTYLMKTKVSGARNVQLVV